MNLFLKLEKYPALEFLYLFPGLMIAGIVLLIFKCHQIKTIHAQGLVAAAIAVTLGKLFNLPVIVSTHSIYNFPDTGFYRKVVQQLMRSSKKILTLSSQSKEEILNLGLDEKKVSVFTYWINHFIFKPINKEMVREKLNLPRNKFICLFVDHMLL